MTTPWILTSPEADALLRLGRARLAADGTLTLPPRPLCVESQPRLL